jgi:hypothetical protein
MQIPQFVQITDRACIPADLNESNFYFGVPESSLMLLASPQGWERPRSLEVFWCGLRQPRASELAEENRAGDGTISCL